MLQLLLCHLMVAATPSGLTTEDENSDMMEFEEVVSKTKIAISSPAEGSISQSSPRIFVNVHTPDVDMFSRHFNDSYVCVQLDKQPYACWPISFAVIKLANLPTGPHSVRICSQLFTILTHRYWNTLLVQLPADV